MTISRFLAGAAERHLLQDRHVVLDHRGLADHEAGGVIEEDTTSDAHGRIDIGLEHRRRLALQIIGEVLATPAPQPMGETMGLDRVEALEVEHRLEKPIGGGVAVQRRDDICTKGIADRRLVFERVGVGLADQFGRDLRTIKTLGNAVNDRRLQRVVMQNRRIDERRELGLAPCDLLGLATDARPDRVYLIQPSGSHLLLGHDRLRTLHHPRKPSTFGHAMDHT